MVYQTLENTFSVLAGMTYLLATFSYLLPFISFTSYSVSAAVAPTTASCRCFPGDSCYPNANAWNLFNQTLGGKLIASVPIAAVCHHDQFEAYDEKACATLRDNWFHPEPHLSSPSSPMAWMFTNNSCNPFLPPETPCTLGNE
jgi:hypothetical protein